MSLPPIGRRDRHGRSRPGGTATLVALLLAVLVSFVGQTGSAYAAALNPTTPTPTAATPKAGAEASPKADPKPAAPKIDPQVERAAAVKALGQSDLPDTCSGAILPDAVYLCAAMSGNSSSFTLTLPQPTDLVFIQTVGINSSWLQTKLNAPDGSAVDCQQQPTGSGLIRCRTGQAGNYTLVIANNMGGTTGFSVAYTPLFSDPGCTAIAAADRTLGAPKAHHGSLAAGSSGNCYSLDATAGEVLRTSLSIWQATATVYDSTGTQVCTTNDNNASTSVDCKLTGTAPYRLLTNRYSGTPVDYDLTVARLSTPEGCPVVEPQAYGTVPDLSSTARCRTLHVPTAGSYDLGPVATGTAPSGALYRADGTQACAVASCTLAAGDYTWVVEARNADAGAFGMSFNATNETRGCTATTDTGFVSGAVTGTFGGPGQKLCRTLPTATGNGLYLLNQRPADGTSVGVRVYDANGAQQCDNSGYSYSVCKLTGVAPFRAVLNGDASKAFQLTIQRTGDNGGCTAWPQSGFGGSWGAEVSLTADRQALCLSLPANQHSTAEMFDYENLKNQVNASIRVVDAAGNELCSTVGSSTTTCVFTAGVSYTAMLVGTGWADTYKLVRRDISPTANCLAPKSTTVGGQSTPLTFTSALDARCVRVTGAATDKFWLSSRTTANRYQPTTLLQVVDAGGKIVCRQWGVACRVTGSTSYVAIVVAAGYNGSDIATNVDAWKVGTAAGWAPECTANQVSVEGFPLRSGVLTESATAYCAVIDVKPSQAFNVYGTSSNTTSEAPWVSLLSGPNWADNNYLGYQCGGSSSFVFGSRCQTLWDSAASQALLMVSPNKAATPVEYTMQGVCDTGCATRPPYPAPTSISPATGAAGTQTQAVISGSGLTLGTKVKLVNSTTWSSTQPIMHPVSVRPDGTALTVTVDTNGLEPGTYDVVLDGIGYTSGTPSPGYLPKAYTVTAAAVPANSRFFPITPTRFLDTRYGTGAAKQQVGPGGVVPLQVTGVHGVPATGVTAVVMNVTVVNPSQGGFVTVYPDGQPVPGVSNLNFAAGQTIPNLVTVPVVNGKVDLRNAFGTVDLVADVTGYYTAGSGGSGLMPITPTRFLDTRYGTGAAKQQVGPGGVVPLQVTGVHGVPATGVTAVVMNVTVVNPSQGGFVTVYPDGQPVPGVSNLNFTAGQTVPNLVTVPVVNGRVDLRNAFGTVDLVADVTGYFSSTGSSFSTAGPVRLLDTRSGAGARAGAVGQGGIVSLQVSGAEGVPLTGVTAVVLNVTVTAPTAGSYLTVYPHGQPAPGVSNLNFGSGQTISNLVVVPVVDGRVTFYNPYGNVQVIGDLNGYYSS